MTRDEIIADLPRMEMSLNLPEAEQSVPTRPPPRPLLSQEELEEAARTNPRVPMNIVVPQTPARRK